MIWNRHPIENNNNIFYYFLLYAFFLYLFLVFNANFIGPDHPIYYAYTRSIVEEGDLNVVNQFYRGEKVVTQTYNFPDQRNYAGILLWIPFYVYAKAAHFLADKFDIYILFERMASCTMSFSTVVFAFLTIIFTYLLCRRFFPKKAAVLSVLVIFWGTPFFYYCLCEPANSNILGSLFSILSIWFFSYVIFDSSKRNWFLYGLFFSIGVAIRGDLWFHSFFCAFFLLKRKNQGKIPYFIFGFIPITLLRAVNAFLKSGIPHMEDFRYMRFLYYFKDCYWDNALFNNYRGIFYTSPVLYICLLGLILMGFSALKTGKNKVNGTKRQDAFLLVITSYLLIKLFIISGLHRPGADLGGRFLITEFPILTLLCARVLQNRKKYFLYFISLASALCVFWNILIISELFTGVDWVYIAGHPPLLTRIKNIQYVLHSFFGVKDLNLKLKLCLPILLGAGAMFFYVLKVFGKTAFLFNYLRHNNAKAR